MFKKEKENHIITVMFELGGAKESSGSLSTFLDIFHFDIFYIFNWNEKV